MDRRISLIGFGNMGQALVRGWLERGLAPESLRVVDPSAAALDVARALGIAGAAEIGAAALREHRPNVVVLAVKPAQLDAALRDAQPVLGAEPLFVSIVAGKPIASISAVLADAAIVRAMPNTPAAIGRGMTVMIASERVAAEQRALADELLRAVGETAWVDDERLMDAVTAVSGSGPAYVFLLIESLTRAGIALGLAPPLAEKLATVTVAGAGAYARESDADAAELRRRVTSPGGTTEAALRVLTSEQGLGALLERAVRAAADRSRELSGA
jgi:pyrroline-5-carboxylate reductase